MASSADRKKGRYKLGGTVEQFSNRLGWWERTIMPFQSDDVILRIDSALAGRPDLIANLVYGSPEFQWVVLQYNTILDPQVDLKEGAIIRLPVASRIQ